MAKPKQQHKRNNSSNNNSNRNNKIWKSCPKIIVQKQSVHKYNQSRKIQTITRKNHLQR